MYVLWHGKDSRKKWQLKLKGITGMMSNVKKKTPVKTALKVYKK